MVPQGRTGLDACEKWLLKMEPNNPVPIKLMVVADHPSPHMCDLLSELALTKSIIAKTIYLSDRNPLRLWKEESHFGDYEVRKTAPLRVCNMPVVPDFGIRSPVDRFDPDVVCLTATYQLPTVQFLTRHLAATGRKWFLYNEALAPHRGSLVARLAKALLVSCLRGADGAVCIGSKARWSYRELIGPGKPVTVGMYCEDLSAFLKEPRARYFGGPLRLLYYGRLLALKRLDEILAALESMDTGYYHLDIFGDGPERERLMNQAAHQALNVTFHPWLSKDRLPALLASHHCLLLASVAEGWGMVVAESLAAGLVVLVRETVGAADLVVHEDNGILLPDFDMSRSLRWWLQHLHDNPCQVERISVRAREKAASLTPAAAASSLTEMAVQVLRTPSLDRRALVSWPTLAKRTTSSCVKRVLSLAPWKTARYCGLRMVFYHTAGSGEDHFAEHLAFFCGDFNIVKPGGDMAESLSRERALIVAIDDCYKTTVEFICNAMEQRGVKALLFVPTVVLARDFHPEDLAWFCRRRLHRPPLEFVDDRMILELWRAGHCIGSHTHSHLDLALADLATLRSELTTSKHILENLTGRDVRHLAYPYGRPPRTSELEVVKESGYTYGWTCRRGVNRLGGSEVLLRRDHLEGSWRLKVVRYHLAHGVTPSPIGPGVPATCDSVPRC